MATRKRKAIQSPTVDFILSDDNPKCPRAMSHWENAFDRAFPKGRKPLDHQTYARIEASAFNEYKKCEGH